MMQPVTFPMSLGSNVNMMPIIMGDWDTIPTDLQRYIPMIAQCKFNAGDTVYLTVSEGVVRPGSSNRRGGIHTDATNELGWGGAQGIYIASNDGLCRIWENDVTAKDVDYHGGLLKNPGDDFIRAAANYMYHIGEFTPHESILADREHLRQFFRVVGPDIGAWYAAHSTPNYLGVKAKAKVITQSKFA